MNLNDFGLNMQHLEVAKTIDETLYLGRVSVQHKDRYAVITESGEIQAQLIGKMMYEASSTLDYPAVGDWVLLDRKDNTMGQAMIHHILPRTTVLERKVPGNRFDHQLIATNVDTIFLCMALNDDFNLRRLERYISMAYSSGATPIIILTKSDLCEELSQKVSNVSMIAIGLDIIVCNHQDCIGYDKIRDYIETGQTVAFIGSSGIGKSTIVNYLMGESLLKTNTMTVDGLGKHTTTHRQLFLLSTGGVIMDTPGMKEIGMVSANLDISFADIEALAKHCKFTDCSHELEPQCAVKAAIQRKELDCSRFESYKKLQKELKYQELKDKKAQRIKQKSLKKR